MNHRGEIECLECLGAGSLEWGYIEGDEQGEGFYTHSCECWACEGRGWLEQVEEEPAAD